jgi:hypothetical protein
MPKMTKAQARRRITEAWVKLRKVFSYSKEYPLSAKDMEAIDRIFKKAKNKLK